MFHDATHVQNNPHFIKVSDWERISFFLQFISLYIMTFTHQLFFYFQGFIQF